MPNNSKYGAGGGKVMTMRVSQDLYDQIKLVAAIDGVHIQDVVREAVKQYLARRVSDPGFKAKAEAYVNRQQEMSEMRHD